VTAPIDVARLRRLLEEGTPGEWTVEGAHAHLIKGCLCLSCEEATGWWLSNMPFCDEVPTAREAPRDGCRAAVLPYPDAALIVAMHETLPQLLERIEELEDAIESMDHARDCRGFMHADGRVWKPCNCARALLGASSSPLGAD
jgi:hypothetical protein